MAKIQQNAQRHACREVKMKLWVDDIRPAPEGWTRARSVTEAIRILATMAVEEVSLDHDISMKVMVGDEDAGFSEPRPFRSNETFEPVARFIAAAYPVDDDGQSQLFVTIHTANSVAASKMAAILHEFRPAVRLSKPCNRFEFEESK